MSAAERLLVVDDESTIVHVLSHLLTQEGYEVATAGSAEAALACLVGPPFALAMLDIVLPGMNGLALIERIKQHDADTEVVMMTSHASAQTAIDALRHGAYDYLHKPFELDDVIAVAARAIEKRRLTRQNRQLLEDQLRQNEELRAAVKRLRSLNAAGIGMSGMASLEELLDFFVALVEEELDAQRVSLMLVDESGSELVIASARGLESEVVLNTRVPLGVGVAGRVAQSGHPLFSSTDSEDARALAAGHPGATGDFLSIPITLSVPIRTPKDVLGVLNVTSRRGDQGLTDDDASYLSALAGQMAVAIERARHSDRLHQAYQNLRSAQDQLVVSSRLKALGEMAAGVAHDFNNVLNGVLARGQLIQREVAKDPMARDRIQEHASLIEKLAWQGAETVRRIQEFSRIRKDRPSERVRVGEAAQLAVALTEPKWRGEARSQGITITVETESDEVPAVAANRQELVQAISNLIFNAVEAMPEGGRVGLRTSLQDGEIRLSVSDTGQGMKPETREQLFDPFFTTKSTGQGLGLSVVYGIMTRFGGRIEVASQEGEGTCITLVFPIPAESERVTEVAATPAPAGARRRARVLAVDDEEMNLAVCREVLIPEGHEVLTAASGEEALRLVAQESFDLVITDLVMPGLSGWDVASGVKRCSPRTRVLLLSGWAVQQNEEEVRAAGVDRVLTKPVGVVELLDSVQQLLAA